MSDNQERDLDETLEETFPASDPPANTVETGVHIDGGAAGDPDIVDNQAGSRFELHADGQVAFLVYERTKGSLVLVHTEVPEGLRGRGIADRLARHGIRQAELEGLRMVPVCPFVRAYLRKHHHG